MTSLKHLKDRITECPTCGGPCEMSWSGLDLVENTGDETLATKHYISKAPDLLKLCDEMKDALEKVKSQPCLACGCSSDVHADDGRCPEFFNGQLYGWADTFFRAENSLPEIDSALNSYAVNFNQKLKTQTL